MLLMAFVAINRNIFSFVLIPDKLIMVSLDTLLLFNTSMFVILKIGEQVANTIAPIMIPNNMTNFTTFFILLLNDFFFFVSL